MQDVNKQESDESLKISEKGHLRTLKLSRRNGRRQNWVKDPAAKTVLPRCQRNQLLKSMWSRDHKSKRRNKDDDTVEENLARWRKKILRQGEKSESGM